MEEKIACVFSIVVTWRNPRKVTSVLGRRWVLEFGSQYWCPYALNVLSRGLERTSYLWTNR